MKKIIRQCFSLVATLVIVASPMIAKAATDWGVGVTSNGDISVGVGSKGSGAGNVWGGGTTMMGGGFSLGNSFGLPSGSILGIATNLLFWLLALFAIMGVVGFVLSGIWYLVGAGDEGMAEKGKEGMKFSIIGIIVGLSGFLIIQAVNAFLSGSSKTF